MKKRGKFIVAAIVILICIFISAVYFGTHTVTRNLKKYRIWDEREIEGSLAIFPQTLNEMGAEKYYYKCAEGLLDSACQIYLECNMTEKMFESEKNRLSGISDIHGEDVQKIVYDDSHFQLPAYVTIYNFDSTYEYALLDEEHKTIYYIHLQFVSEKDIVFDKSLLPADYMVESTESMDMYEHWLDDIDGWVSN